MNSRVGRILFLLTILSIAINSEAENQDKIDGVVDHEYFDNLNEIINDSKVDSTQINTDNIEVQNKDPKLFGNKDNDDDLGMDAVTIIWYLTTFTALFGFFIVMACTDNNCHRRRLTKPAETRHMPSSPCPSYKNFAPPSYGSVMKKMRDQKVFIVPVHNGNNNFFNNPVQDGNRANEDVERNDSASR